MRCPNCGTENPDFAQYCSSCAVPLKDESVAAANVASSRSSPLTIATLALTIALVLRFLGFVLAVYFLEELTLNPHGHYYSVQNTIKAMNYSNGFGDLAVILGLIFIVQALMANRSGASPLVWIRQARLSLVMWMLIVAAILMAVNWSIVLSVNDLNLDMDYDLAGRLTWYPAGIARLAVISALLTFTVALRQAEKSKS